MTIPFRDVREARRLRADEVAQVVALLSQASENEGIAEELLAPDWWLSLLADTEKIAYVAAPVGQKALGVVAVEPVPGEDSAYRAPLLWIEPGRRREGWGSKLADRAIVWARRRTAKSVVFTGQGEGADNLAESLGLTRCPEGWAKEFGR